MTNAQKVFDFLSRIAPKSAANEDIRAHTGVRPHQQVFQITQRLMQEGKIKGRRIGREWNFWVDSSNMIKSNEDTAPEVSQSIRPKSGSWTPSEFEVLAKQFMGKHLGVEMTARKIPGVHKTFDLVSEDLRIVGDAKYYTAVGGERIPPAKFSVIAEHV